jgi:hypothetical protein
MSDRTALFELVEELAQEVREAFGPTATRIDTRISRGTQHPDRAFPDAYEIRNAQGQIIPPSYAFLRTLSHPLPVPVDTEEAYLHALSGNETLIEQLNRELYQAESGPGFALCCFIEFRVFEERSGSWVSLNLPEAGPAGRRIVIPWAVQDVLGFREDLSAEQATRVLLEAQAVYHPERTVTRDMLGEVAEGLYPQASVTRPVYLMVLGHPGQPESFEWRWTPEEIWELFDAKVDEFRSLDLVGRVSHLMHNVPLHVRNDGESTVEQHLHALLPHLMRAPQNRLAVYAHTPAAPVF